MSGGSGSVHGSAEVAPGGIGTSSHPSTATGNNSSDESSSDECSVLPYDLTKLLVPSR